MNRKSDLIIGMAFLGVLGVSCLYVLGGNENSPESYSFSSNWVWNDYDRVMQQAQEENKYVIIDFWAVWCDECKKMDRVAFRDPEVCRLLGRCVLLKVDVDVIPELKSQFRVMGMPTVVIVSPEGDEVSRAVGYQTTEQIKRLLMEVLE
ncbi:MAG: thioredoxin family protein [Theionarchaea archaeon]|nr:thioredoxin family protein [Theionarchaea archaeon]MBU7001435.1 thioredoxin family protein [Theionarchaea archaeon]MBU7021896.1 thioredoxin family protein [Theionarchaea archaeon]MBU7034348.1 thioredoxin family protein [Theionarchaea archaeon]MBU7040313.1 thioredoxin family protein [Theionarchaea archaeon]